MKAHAGPPQIGGMCWPALTRTRKRSRPVVQLPTRALQQRASCCGSLSLVANARAAPDSERSIRSEEHTSELQSLTNLVCRLLLEKKKKIMITIHTEYTNIHNYVIH